MTLKRLTTSVLYQPSEFGKAVGPLSVMVGAMLSIFTLSPALCGLPALSLTWQLIVCVPSPEIVVAHGLELPESVSGDPPSSHVGLPARPERSSLAVMVTSTEL